MDTEALIREVADRMEAIIIVTAAEGLDEDFLGAGSMMPSSGNLCRLLPSTGLTWPEKAGSDETLTLNAPFYSRPITYSSCGSGHPPAVTKWSSGVLPDGPEQ